VGSIKAHTPLSAVARELRSQPRSRTSCRPHRPSTRLRVRRCPYPRLPPGPSPGPVPKISGVQRRDWKCPLSSDFRASATAIYLASLRIREVLRRTEKTYLQGLRPAPLRSEPSSGLCRRCSAVLAQTTGLATLQVFPLILKPSDGLEPSTPSLPWRFWGGNGVHARSLATTFVLQIGPSSRVSDARVCPRVLKLVYPSRTRGTLSVIKTGASE
jgi:hypothetical protein